METYTQILDPDQPDPTGPITLDVIQLTRPEGLAAAVAKKLDVEGRLCTSYGPETLRAMVLDGPLASVWADGHVSIADLFGYMARYPYLRRMASINVLFDTARRGAADLDWSSRFAVAADIAPGVGYTDLCTGSIPASVSARSLIVRPDVAAEQIRRAQATQARLHEAVGRPAPNAAVSPGGKAPASVPAPEVNKAPTRFYAHVELDPERPVKSFDKIAQEIISALASQHGTTLRITVEIEAERPDGFSESAVRTIAENARTLRITDTGFE